ncbi:MAG: hypothetical protein COY40_04160 [Alphaproteobacteria bacterium CG_4_10_14_0_8_um_filter_53_9]|nr:MAG: hypothetical protein COY40_04160 [Alphaproteobacteria bacterium CG_4_10_14_0_8_um_filter_53_9]
MKPIITALLLSIVLMTSALAESVTWRGPTDTLTLGLSQDDISHIEFPEPITNVTLENPDYVDVLVVQGYNNRAFRVRSLLPKMATRAFLTGQSGNTYIAVFTTDIPYRAFVQVVNGLELDDIKKAVAKQFGPKEMVRAMSQDADIPGVLRETYVVPNWFKGGGLTFDLTEVWQSSTLTGLVVNVRNDSPVAAEVNLPAIAVPQTQEWGQLRYAAMENLRLAPSGKANSKGMLFLIFIR